MEFANPLGFAGLLGAAVPTRLPHLVAAVDAGPFISVWKALPALLVLLVWARLLTWADKDADRAHLARLPINTGLLAALIAGALSFFMLPGFGVAFAVLCFFMAASLGAYLLIRNQKVGLKDLGDELKTFLSAPFAKLAKEKKVEAGPGDVLLFSHKGAPVMRPDDEAPELAGFQAIQRLLAGPLKAGAEQIDLVAGEQGTSVRYIVDGMPYTGTPLDKTSGASAVTFTKQLANLDVADRRKPQTGTIKAQTESGKSELQVTTAGSKAGESMRIVVDPKKRNDLKVEQLGMTDDQIATIDALVRDPGGLVLLSAPKGMGLTSLLYAMVRRHDAFLTNIATVEREKLLDLEGITQNVIPAPAGAAEELKMIEWVVSQEPDVIMVPQVENPRSAAPLIQHAAKGRRTYVGVRASSTFDAIAQWRRAVSDDKLALKQLRFVINARVTRKLCMACKVSYSPDPETLRKMNMSPEKVGKLYQARTQPMRDQRGNPVVCTFCNDLRFKGRVGVYEMFAVDDEVRAAVLAGGSGAQLKQLFRKQKARYLQEQALLLVEQGETSVQEVLRVLRAGEEKSAPAPARASS
jgi:type II secretory ATPase GspE/PulE/Tfp pilus assembly ATPase PilB-like protein